jgi:hypothetical protein
MSTMYDRAPVLARNLDFLTTQDDRKNTRRRRPLKADRTLQVLVADLVAARAAAGMTQEEVAVRMWTTKSAISRIGFGSMASFRPMAATGSLPSIPALTHKSIIKATNPELSATTVI